MNPISIGLFVAAGIIQLHHYLHHGYWFDKDDFDCHEIWFVGLLAVGVGILIGSIWVYNV